MRIARRSTRLLAVCGIVSAVAAAGAPEVGATDVHIRFTSTTGSGIPGSNVIEAEPGDVLTAVMSVEPDAAGVSNYVLSLEFDAGSSDGLDLVSVTEQLDPSFQLNLDAGCASTQESTGSQAGQVLSCEAATLQDGPVAPVSVDVAEVVFQVTNGILAQDSVLQTGLYSPGVDGIFDNAGNALSPSFGGAMVVPEPGLEALLAGLALMGLRERWRRRR